MEAETIESLIAWFRATVAAVPFGEIGIVVSKHEGQVTTTRRIHNETHRVLPTHEDYLQTLGLLGKPHTSPR